MKESKSTHMKVTRKILLYIKDNITHGLLYLYSNDFQLIVYSNSDWGDVLKDQKSIIDFCFLMRDIALTLYLKK